MEWAGSHTSLNTAPSYSYPTEYEKVVLVSKSKITKREDHSYCFLPFKTTRKKKEEFDFKDHEPKVLPHKWFAQSICDKKNFEF